MKKTLIVTAAIALIAAVCVAGCNAQTNSGKEENFTVTFVQSGQTDVIKTVKKGDSLTDIPDPVSKTGYTVTWNRTDFGGITENITVTAVETANEYTITYQPGNGTLDSMTQTVVYDSQYTLKTPTNNDSAYTFSCWVREDSTSVAQTGTWKIADNVTLTAQYNEPYTITFVQTGYDPIVKKVAMGGSLDNADIPQPNSKAGYTVVWDKTDFSNITESITVSAIETANEYTITYSLGDREGDSYANITETQQSVTYDSTFTLYIPECYGYKFVKWVKTGTDIQVQNGTWNIADNVPLTAVWEIDNNSDRWWSENN